MPKIDTETLKFILQHNEPDVRKVAEIMSEVEMELKAAEEEKANRPPPLKKQFSIVYAFLNKYYGSGDNNQDLRDPIHTVRSKDCFNVVTVEIDGQSYAIADIGLRMLQPKELFAAQGFPDDYVKEWGFFPVNEDAVDEEAFDETVFERRPLSKTAQVKMCGNSVCPQIAAALVLANVPEMIDVSHEGVAV